MTLHLMGRSPVRFCIAIALLGWLDASVFRSVEGLVIPRLWFDWLGLIMVPLILAVVTAIARGADDTRWTWKAFGGFTRATLWGGTIGAGAVVVAVQCVIAWLLGLKGTIHYIHAPGRFLESLLGAAMLFDLTIGLCYVPLLVLEPELSEREARELSRRATRINGDKQIMWLLVCCGFVSMPFDVIPTYGVGEAALLVFLGTLSYVAYRDIFERRSSNLPVAALTVAPVPRPIGPAAAPSRPADGAQATGRRLPSAQMLFRVGRAYRYGHVACCGGPGTGDLFHRAMSPATRVASRYSTRSVSSAGLSAAPSSTDRTATSRTRYTPRVTLPRANRIDDSSLHTHHPSNGAGGH